MISQKCPRCHSDRVRRGYRPTRIWSKIFFRYNLLCNACNWQFRGFAVPFTVTHKPNRKRRKAKAERQQAIQITDNTAEKNSDADVEEYANEQADISAKAVSSEIIRVKKKVRIRQS